MIQSEPEDIEQIRARLRIMSDTELREYGRAGIYPIPKKNFGPASPAFKIQLDKARAGWQRRNRKGGGA